MRPGQLCAKSVGGRKPTIFLHPFVYIFRDGEDRLSRDWQTAQELNVGFRGIYRAITRASGVESTVKDVLGFGMHVQRQRRRRMSNANAGLPPSFNANPMHRSSSSLEETSSRYLYPIFFATGRNSIGLGHLPRVSGTYVCPGVYIYSERVEVRSPLRVCKLVSWELNVRIRGDCISRDHLWTWELEVGLASVFLGGRAGRSARIPEGVRYVFFSLVYIFRDSGGTILERQAGWRLGFAYCAITESVGEGFLEPGRDVQRWRRAAETSYVKRGPLSKANPMRRSSSRLK